jgi:hypothetical protein
VNTTTRRWGLLLTLCAALVACSQAPPPAVRIEAGGSVTPSTLTETAEEAQPLPTTLVEESTTTTTLLVPGGPNDPSGPILCPSLPHPAHHLPCPSTPSSAPTSVAPPVSKAPVVVSEPTAPSTSLAACIRHYESTDGVDPNLYQFVDGTWNLAFQAAKDQGLLDKDTPNLGASGSSRAVQNAAFQAWVNDGHLHQAWAAQSGRCF